MKISDFDKRFDSDFFMESLEAMFLESDRGVILLAAQALDDILSLLHFVTIATHTKSARKMYKELARPFAPLSTFASKMQLAFAYGLIEESIYQELQIIREIRNLAAHGRKKFNFESVKIHVYKITRYTPEESARAFRHMGANAEHRQQAFDLLSRAGIVTNKNKESGDPRWHFIIASMELQAKLLRVTHKIAERVKLPRK